MLNIDNLIAENQRASDEKYFLELFKIYFETLHFRYPEMTSELFFKIYDEFLSSYKRFPFK